MADTYEPHWSHSSLAYHWQSEDYGQNNINTNLTQEKVTRRSVLIFRIQLASHISFERLEHRNHIIY